MKPTRRGVGQLSSLAAAITLTFSAGAATPVGHTTAGTAQASLISNSGPEQIQDTSFLIGADGKADVMIMLRDDPATVAYAHAFARAGANGPLALTAAGAASRETRDRLRLVQSSFMNTLAQSGVAAREIFRVQRALNAVAVRMSPDDMAKVRKLPGVARVEFINPKFIETSSSVPFVNAPQLWEGTPLSMLGAKGEGMRIGIIDTGIDYMHPDFGGTGLLADYQANNTTVITEGGAAAFPTARVVGGTDFAGNAYTGGNAPAPDPDPMDCLGHGSHVAGIAAGNGVNVGGTPYNGPYLASTNYAALAIGPGVAPKAALYSLRVFGCGGSTNLTTQAIDWATDPNDDGDLSDRLDVINMSLGSNYGLPFDDSALASDNATLTGMIVVASAGNAGDTFYISGSPGSGQQVLTVASNVDPGVTASVVRINTPASIAGFYAFGAAQFGNPPPPSGLTGNVVIGIDPADGAGPLTTDGCSPLTNGAAVAGNIALIDRGTCGFTIKVKNAQNAGATGVIIANTSAGAFGGLGGADPTITIPSGMVTFADGNTLKANIATLNATLLTGADTASSFTSRGPRGGDGTTQLKPDISAPGTNITSAQTGITCTGAAGSTGCITVAASGFIANGASLVLSGTSMAAPHTAGYMALLRQLNPGLSVEQIKALAINTAAHDQTTLPNGAGARYPASDIGSGRIDVALGATDKIIAYNDDVAGAVAVAFDDEVVGPTTSTHHVRLVNHTATTQNLTLSLDTVTNSPGVGFSITSPTSVVLGPSATALVTVQMTADPTQMKRFLGPTLALTQVSPNFGNFAYPRSYQAEESALLKVSKGAVEVARVPVYMTHRPRSDMHGTGAVSVTDPATGTLNVALAGTDVCTGTSAGGTCTGSFDTADHVSLVSPFELQVVGDEDPTLPGFANIRYAGVTYDPGNDLYLFGVQMFGKWATPSIANLNICIDTNSDGTYDKVLFNTNAGLLNSRVSNGTASGNDVFFNYMFTPPTTLNLVGDHNVLSPDVVDTGMFDNNVEVLNIDGPSLGLPAGGGSFKYAIAVCPWFNPLCVRLATPTVCDSAGATYEAIPGPFTFNGAARGVTATGGLPFFTGPSLPVLIPEQNGNSIALGYNQANLAANGAHSALLLHHQNQSDGTADVIVLIDAVFKDDFE